MNVKERIHRLLDELPESELRTAERLLAYLRDTSRDPVLQALLRSPAEDELEIQDARPMTEHDRSDASSDHMLSHHRARRRLLDRW